MALQTNNTGNDRDGQKYYESHGIDSHGNPGTWHIYEDSHGKVTKSIFMADPAPAPAPSIGGALGGGSIGAGAVAAAPAPAPAAAPPPAPPVQSNGGVQAPAPGEITLTPVSTAVATQMVTPGPATGATPADNTVPAETATATDTSGALNIPHDGSTSTTDTSSATPVAASAPAAADPAPAADPSSIYSVASGDNMSSIAQAHNMTLQQLQALNPQVQDPNLILPGQQLNLGNGEAVVPASVASSVPVDAAAAFPTTSSYDSTTTQSHTAEARQAGVGGWTDGTNTVPNDPTHGIAAVAPANTDPLKISDDKPQQV